MENPEDAFDIEDFEDEDESEELHQALGPIGSSSLYG